MQITFIQRILSTNYKNTIGVSLVLNKAARAPLFESHGHHNRQIQVLRYYVRGVGV